MKILFGLLDFAILLLTCFTYVTASHSGNRTMINPSLQVLHPRQASCHDQKVIQRLSHKDPVKAAGQVLNIKHILDPDEGPWFKNNIITGDASNKQVPWAKGAKFHWNPFAVGFYPTGYLNLPGPFGDFSLNRTMAVRHKNGKVAKAPFYVSAHYDPKKIERVVIIWPGQWRDSWRYINLLGNAHRIALKYPELDAKSDNVLMISPVFFNQKDHKMGALKKDEIFFHDAGWAVGGTTRGPSGFEGISSFSIMDFFLDFALNTTNFPNVKHAVVAGHSMGAQAALRYAILRKPEKHDNMISYWVGNPGTFLWLDDKRPGNNHTNHCKKYNDFPFGLGGNAPAYGRKYYENPKGIVDRFQNRKVHYAFGMNDNGGTSDACSPNAQGPNRISRAAHWVQSLARIYGEFPKSQTVDFVECISHQDYPMVAHYQAIKYMFSPHEN